jgi:hypothetical protein
MEWLFGSNKTIKQPKTVVSHRKRRKTRKCSPMSIKEPLTGSQEDTCFTPSAASTLQQAFNAETTPSNRLQASDPIGALAELKAKNKCTEDECLVNSIKNHAVREKLKQTIFKPEQPHEWKKNPNEWLSNFDILAVLKQYEEAYPTFEFIGPVPIDFNAHLPQTGTCVETRLCNFSVSGGGRAKPDIGIIFNLDKHDEPGSHWVSMFIDCGIKTMFYFDSAMSDEDLPKEIVEFKKKIQGQDPAYKFLSNDVEHQRGNSECGMYSLYFIINMLLSGNRRRLYQSRFNNPKRKITDKAVERYRRVYFIA